MAKNSKVDYSVVIPVYNSEKNLKPLTSRLNSVFNKLKLTYEIILVDDYSQDNSRQFIKELAKTNHHLKYIFLTRNFGQHNALFAGFNNVRGKIIITMDDDLQHPPEEIPKLIRHLKKGNYEVVFGQYINRKHSWLKNLGSSSAIWLIKKLTNSNYQITSFRIFTARVNHEITQYKGSLVTTSSMINRSIPSDKIGVCLTKHESRINGNSGYNLKKLIMFFLKQLTLYSLEPLFWPLYFGLLFFLISLLVGVILVILSYFDHQILNLILNILIAFAAVVVSFLVLLLGLAVTYLAHLVSTAQGWPQYRVSESNIKNYQ